MAVKPIPEGYHTLTPYLAVEDATRAIEFYKRAFGATERVLMRGPNDMVAHCELEVGDSLIMLSDPFGHEWNIATHVEDLSPEEIERRGEEAMAAMSSGAS